MAWINPYYNPDNSVAGGGNVRYDHTQPGSGIPKARTFADGAKLFDQYYKSRNDNTVYNDAVGWLTKKGFDPKLATDQQKFTALDWVFRDRQRGNKKENFGFDDIAGFVGPAVGFATGNPWLGAAAGGISSGASSGFNPLQTALGAVGGYAAGSSGLFGGDGFLGSKAGPISNFFKGGSSTSGLASAAANAFPDAFGAATGNALATGLSPVAGAAGAAGGALGSSVGLGVLGAVSGLSSNLLKRNAGSIGSTALKAGNALLGSGDVSPAAATAGAAIPTVNALSNPVTDRYNYALADALTGNGGSAQSIQGGSLRGGAGSGRQAPEMGRIPGYQRRPFGNYLMRAA